MINFMDLIKARYSVRSFSDKKVEEDKLNQILEAAKLAPTAKNNQPWRIYILQSKEALDKINSICSCIFSSSTVFVVCYNTEEVYPSDLNPGYHTGDMDAAIVGTHMMLAAWELGIGSCWVKRFSMKEVSEALNLPPHIKPSFLMPIGYASENSAPSPMHESYRDMKELVKKL